MNLLKTLGLLLLLCIICFWLFYQFRFLRNPERLPNENPNLIISPAYGEVSAIIKRYWVDDVPVEKKYAKTFLTQTSDMGSWGYLINIMMTPLDIHYQRAPIESTLIKQEYVPGKFLNAVTDPSSLTAHFENERNEMTFETWDGFRYKIIQIAGFLARRIHSHVEIDQQVTSAETIGLISLGSQVSILLPPEVILDIEVWQRVVDGVTVIAERTDNRE